MRRGAWRAGRRRGARSLGGATVGALARCLGMAGQLTSLPSFARWGGHPRPRPPRPRPHPRRLRHYHPLPQDAPDVQPRARTVHLPPLKHVVPSPPQGSERSKTWGALPKRSIDPLPPVRGSGVSRCSAESSCSGASSPAPHSSPDGPGALAIETHAMGMVDEKLNEESFNEMTGSSFRSSLCAIL